MPLRARHRDSITRLRLLAGVALAAWAGGAPGLAGEFNAMGDGSESTNADLLDDSTAGCENCVLDAPPHEWDAPYFDLDWSLALRGAYVRDADGEHYEALAVPSVTLTHRTMRGGYDVSTSAELAKSSLDTYRLAALRAAAGGDYRLDALTSISGNLDLSLTQDSPGAPGIANNIAAAPIVGSAEAGVAVTRAFGFFDVGLRGRASRTVYGPTTLVDATVVDNSAQNNWTVGTGLRLGYAVTPILTAFVDGSAGYQFYDLPSPIYLEKLDAVDYAVRAGLGAKWSSVLEAEGSIGLGLRRFAVPAFGEVVSTLYDAKLTFRPDETVALGGTFSTAIGAPGPSSGGLARIEYAAAADASYRLNTWLKLRASVGWRHALLVGTTTTETGYNAGTGLDYLLNEFATLTADYAYRWA
ncbi:MAG: outer membrane beta-barrel protein, partial [Devosia sp.]